MCLNHKRCGPKADFAATTEINHNCKCLANGYNNADGITHDRQFKAYDSNGNLEPYGLQDCPNVPATEMNETGNAVSNADTLTIIAEKELCLTKNKQLHDHCDVDVQDKVTVNPNKSSDTYPAKCTCTVEGSDGTQDGEATQSPNTIVHYIGQPIGTGVATNNSEAQVCKGGQYEALTDESQVGTYTFDNNGVNEQVPYLWKSHIVECNVTPQHVCPPHQLKYERCKTLEDKLCTGYRPTGAYLDSMGEWVDSDGVAISTAIKQTSEFISAVADHSSCLIQTSNVDVNWECNTNFVKAVRNKYLIICYEEGKMLGSTLPKAKFDELSALMTPEELTSAEAPDQATMEQFCLEYVTLEGVTTCLMYSVDEFIARGEVQRQYIYPFLRFYLRQSQNGEESSKQFIDASGCTNVNSLGEDVNDMGFSTVIPSS